ncbi:hypothetical protein [Pandoraea communis]|uniref:hypothetical protein n=1 Tax=Pandoraea communis TaxID=2508297 RepID=UPI0025A65343|nr:hypothetical protein [Pandoraea communis]MDM8356591.1 hypothetical protein [Pandoraea communis]
MYGSLCGVITHTELIGVHDYCCEVVAVLNGKGDRTPSLKITRSAHAPVNANRKISGTLRLQESGTWESDKYGDQSADGRTSDA